MQRVRAITKAIQKRTAFHPTQSSLLSQSRFIASSPTPYSQVGGRLEHLDAVSVIHEEEDAEEFEENDVDISSSSSLYEDFVVTKIPKAKTIPSPMLQTAQVYHTIFGEDPPDQTALLAAETKRKLEQEQRKRALMEEMGLLYDGLEDEIDPTAEDPICAPAPPGEEFVDYGFTEYLAESKKPKKNALVSFIEEEIAAQNSNTKENPMLLIDVRSPSEFKDDHCVGSINLPVLDDQERKVVGTLHKENPFEARRLGARLISTNIGTKILASDVIQTLPKHAKIHVQCWRGGERSKSLSHILSRIGFDTSVVSGGYKTYRALVRQTVDGLGMYDLKVLSGVTGIGKSLLLDAIRRQGGQVIDLERAASHFGSILGLLPGVEQPSQRMFESLLFAQMRVQKFNLARPVYVEFESSRVGKLSVPSELWQKMQRSPVYEIHAPMELRVANIRKQYTAFEQPEHRIILIERLKKLADLHPQMMAKHQALTKSDTALSEIRKPAEVMKLWEDMMNRNDWNSFVENLLRIHYDPSYALAHSRRASSVNPMMQRYEINAEDPLDDACVTAAYDEVASEILAEERE